ncbi:MAG: phosphodiester glycosidase family protein, partial [Planctomycetota bacterium]
LSDPAVQVIVTGPRTGTGAGEAVLTRTDQWRTSVGADLAINANFFGIISGSEADIVGLSVSDGSVISPVRTFGGQPDPALVFTDTGAQAGRISNLTGVTHAVAGVGGSSTDSDPGTMLVLDGVNLGATARVAPGTKNPRTAAGVSADGQTLYLAVIDGRQNGWSNGVTLADLAQIMIDLGADDAINLDGGGSSSFIADIDGTLHENRPSDGAHRAVANHLGIAISTSSNLIAADSFDVPPYTTGTSLNGQNPTVGPGWTGAGSSAWSVGTANLQPDTGTLLRVETSYEDNSTGKGQFIANPTDFYRAGHHGMDTYAPADTYFMSFFVNPGSGFLSSGSREHAVVGFTNFFNEGAFENTNSDDVFGLFAGFRGDDAGALPGQADLILRARNGAGDLQDTVLVANVQASTYHVIYKLEVNAAGSDDVVTWWVNPSDLSSEAAMTGSAVATGVVNTDAMTANDQIDRLFVLANNWARVFFWDETRMGYDLASVVNVATQPDPEPVGTTRPIRGAWLRPPGSTLLTEMVLDKFAEAGGTDLFLETFYHGLSTSKSDIFNDRFSTDVLLETMELAHQRGIRVHAWLEAAYWSFSGSGLYILNQNPDWKVVDDDGATDIGDQSGQIFVNLGNPGVQAMLQSYCEELASKYPMLWGVHTDYHRFPLDNDGSDGQIGPYSFDTWSRNEFQSIYGVDPLTSARFPADPFYDEFVEFRRNGIGLAAEAMLNGVLAGDPGKMFSGAIFATAIADRFCNPNSSQFVKMQDWPTWAANGWLPIAVPMAYGTSTTSIRNDLQAANNQALNPCGTSGNTEANARVIAGLAIINPSSRPGITSQLNVVYGENIDSFIWFELNALVVSQQNIDDMANYILNNGPFQESDFDMDGRIDADDWDAFFSVYTGTPFQSSGPLDLTGDGTVDDDDQEFFLSQFRAFRFGEDGNLGEEEYQAVLDAFTGVGENWPLHLFDLTGDGVVDCADVTRMRTILTEHVGYDINPDVDGNGVVDGIDIGTFQGLLVLSDPRTDLNGDTSFDYLDIAAYLNAIDSACP